MEYLAVTLIWQFGGFYSHCQIKPCHLISAQHGLITVSYATRKAFTYKEEANKVVAKVLEWKMVQRVYSCMARPLFSVFLCGAEA